MTQPLENTLKVAHQAFECFSNGLATGEWNDFLEMLTEDFSFWFPQGKYQGLNIGRQRAKEFFDYVSQAFSSGLTITSVERITSNDTTVVFEFRDEGKLMGETYKNRVAVSFDVREDKICGYREYFGSDGKSN
ncbi:MAG: nuclear transport factor 2 family protein [Cyanobacteria bacterium P01_H01_bin.150]